MSSVQVEIDGRAAARDNPLETVGQRTSEIEVRNGSLYGYKKTITIAAGNSATIVAEATTNNIYYTESAVNIIDDGNNVIDVSMEFFKGAEITSGDTENDLIVNLNEASSETTTVNYYDPTTLVLDDANKVILPFGIEVKVDKRSNYFRTNFNDYVVSDNAAVTFTNNGAGSVKIEYFEYFYES